jgi:mannosyltransferase
MVIHRFNFLLALLLICLGIFAKSSWIIALLRTPASDTQAELLIGASLFRVGLVILGILLIVLRRSSIWKSHDVNDEKQPQIPGNAIVILTIILAAASGLRLYGLNEGLWFDEIFTYLKYVRLPLGEIITKYDTQNNHLLYSALAHISFQLFGGIPWSLRLPAVLFGVASIWALFLLARQVTNTLEALLSSAVLTVSYHHIWFSQNARGYTGLLFFTIITSWLLVVGINKSRPKLWLGYAIISALGTYTHMTMVFVIMSHFIIYLIVFLSRQNEDWRKRKWVPLIGFFLTGFLTLLLYSFVLPQMFGGTISQGSIVASWKNPLWTMVEFIKGVQISFKGIVPGIVAMGIFAIGVWSFARENPMVIGFLLIPSFIAALTTMLMGHHLWPRLFFFTLGFGILVIVRGAMRLGRIFSKLARLPSRASTYPGVVFVGGIILASAISVPAVYAPKQDFLSALRFIEANKHPDDGIATLGCTAVVYKGFYETDWIDLENAQTSNLVPAQGKALWIIYTFPSHLEAAYPEMMAAIKRDFKVVTKFYGTLRGGEIFVCRSRSSPDREMEMPQKSTAKNVHSPYTNGEERV